MADEEKPRSFVGIGIMPDGTVMPGRMVLDSKGVGEMELVEPACECAAGPPSSGSMGWTSAYDTGWERTFGKKRN